MGFSWIFLHPVGSDPGQELYTSVMDELPFLDLGMEQPRAHGKCKLREESQISKLFPARSDPPQIPEQESSQGEEQEEDEELE